MHIVMVQKKYSGQNQSNPWRMHGRKTTLGISQKVHVYIEILVLFFQLKRGLSADDLTLKLASV